MRVCVRARVRARACACACVRLRARACVRGPFARRMRVWAYVHRVYCLCLRMHTHHAHTSHYLPCPRQRASAAAALRAARPGPKRQHTTRRALMHHTENATCLRSRGAASLPSPPCRRQRPRSACADHLSGSARRPARRPQRQPLAPHRMRCRRGAGPSGLKQVHEAHDHVPCAIKAALADSALPLSPPYALY